MSSDQTYVPSDEDMREGFVQDMAHPKSGRRIWDAWLAAHDARVRNAAAREALDGLAKAALDRVAHVGKHSYAAQIAQRIAQDAWNYKWKHYGGAHPEGETR